MALGTLIFEDDNGKILDARQVEYHQDHYPEVQIQDGRIVVTGFTCHKRKDVI